MSDSHFEIALLRILKVFTPSDLSTAGEDMDSLRGKHAIWLERRIYGVSQTTGLCTSI